MNISEKAKNIADNCRFCWMCRHVCPVGNATGQERNNARARALAVSLAERGAEELSEIIDNLYECTLCGACSNNCVTGWDPKVFVRETRTEAVLSGVVPAYVKELYRRFENTGNVYGAKEPLDGAKYYSEKKTATLLFYGEDAAYRCAGAAKNLSALLKRAGEEVTSERKAESSGASLYFLLGKTEEVRRQAEKCAAYLNRFDTVIVYDPADLAFFLHEYREWGITVTAKLVGFNEYLLELIGKGALNVKKSSREYALQDNYAYARELDDTETARKLIDCAGVRKEMLLNGKEANLAGNLVMNEYMPEVMERVARERWINAVNSECRTLVTENPAEYALLKKTAPAGCRVLSVEEMLLENL